MVSRLVWFVVFAVSTLSLASAQDSRGSIQGVITDSGGAPIASADVRAVSTTTGVVASARSNAEGIYVIPFLVPGTYQVRVEMAGFKRFIREVQVRVGDAVAVDIALQIGDVSESVEVTAETPLLSTAEVSLGQVIDQRRLQELPLFAGNAMDLVHLAPGTVNGTNLRLRKAPFNAAPSTFSSDGGGNNQNDFTIDGVSNLYSDGTAPRVAFSPPQYAIGEFKVQTASFDAAQGFTMGSVVNVNSKGGANDFHGEVHWWLRHSKLDSKTIFQNRAGLSLPIYQDNRYGASAGSPIVIPKIYNGKNRTFWFFAWEANKFGDPNVGQNVSTVPTAAQRVGDLSALRNLGPAFQIYDPATTVATGNGQFQRQPFAGNIIPENRIDPVARAIMSYYPLPNQPGNADGTNNYFTSNKALEDYWTTIGRVDHAFNDKHRMFVRFHRDYWQEDKNRLFPGPATGIILNRVNRGIALDDVYVLSPAFLINIRYGVTAQEFPERRVSRGFELASLGFGPTVVNAVDPSLATFPRTAITPWSVLSNWESGDGTTTSLIHNPVVAMTWLKGKHNMRFGTDMRFIREFRNRFPADSSPNLIYDSEYTSGPFNTSPDPQLGGQIASFLLGIPGNGANMTRTASYAEKNAIYGFYFQDDFKVSRRLTLNLGVRYEYETPMSERYNRSVYDFAYGQVNPIQDAARAAYARNPIAEISPDQFRVLGGLTFAGVNGNPSSLWNADKNNIMPRVGLAFQLTQKTVIRAGYGIFYAPMGTLYTNTIQTGFSQTTPVRASLDNGLTFVANNANPFPDGLIQPQGAAGGLTTNLGQALNAIDTTRKNPYAQRWSFGFQQQLPGRFLIEMSYVGNRGTQLNINQNINAIPLEYLSNSLTRDQARITYLGQQFANPFLGLDPIYTANISRANLLRPYPQFGDINILRPTGYSWYHSLQSRIERRFENGFTFQFSHTWSKTMEATEFLNAADTRPYESVSGLDRTIRWTMSGVWELPFGKGRRWGSNMHTAVDLFAGGWQLGGMVQTQSGAPLAFGNRIFNGNLADINLSSDERSVDRWFNTNAGFERSSANQLASNVRYFPLRFSGVRGPGQNRVDLSLIKNFRMTERFVTQFRAETYNAFNHVNLANPNVDPTSGAFGQITGQDPPKSWQFALRVSF